MNKIHIMILKETKSIYKVIGSIAKEEYYHVCMTTDGDLDKMIGFRSAIKIEKASKMNHNKECKLMEMEVTDEQLSALRNSISSYLENREKYKYNVIGLLVMCFIAVPLFDRGVRFIVKPMVKLMRRKDKFICSTFIINLFYENDMRILDHLNDPNFGPSLSPWLMSPYGFDRIGLKQVYQGTIGELIKGGCKIAA